MKAPTQHNATDGKPTPSTTRWRCHLILMFAAVVQLSRIVQVESSTGDVPFLSANDRSRWCTIAALAIKGTYEIDEFLQIRDPISHKRTWYTIDLVRHRGADGRQHFYSSKPPLLPTLYAGVYIAIRSVTGLTLSNDLFFVARAMLVIVNLLPLVAFWWLLIRWIEREKLGEWGTFVVCLMVAWGTFLSTFAATLNNHVPAAIAVGLSLWCIDRIALQQDHRWRWFILSGVACSFGAANELPALSWTAAAGAILLLVDARRTLLGYLPALLPMALAFFGTNYMAHGELLPAYAHRGMGEKLFEFDFDSQVAMDRMPVEFVARQLESHGFDSSGNVQIKPARQAGVYEFWDADRELRFALRRDGRPSKNRQMIGVYDWGDWYDYPNSYWTSERKQGVDRGEPQRGIYIFHSLIGHHGIFSLTPFWLVSLWGSWTLLRSRTHLYKSIFNDYRLLIATAIAATSLVVVGFYLARPLEDRNYGGVASGFRWAFWLIPLWIWLAMQGMRAIQTAWARRLVEFFLLVSLFSANFPWNNPWTSPWLMQYWESMGWNI